MQQPRHRIRRSPPPPARPAPRPRSPCVTAAHGAASTTAVRAPAKATAGPAATAADSRSVAPCMIAADHGRPDVARACPTPPGYARSTGTVRALNLMIDFPDAPGEGSALDRFAEFFPQTPNWFTTSSYGRLDYRPEAPVTEWLRMPKPFAAYGIERGAPFEPGYRQLVQDIVRGRRPAGGLPAYDLVNVLVTPNAGPSALDTVLSVTFAGNHEAPIADGVPRRQHVLRLQPPGRRLGLVRARPATGSCPTRTAMSSACPTSTPHGGRGRGRALGHHERGLGRQQRPAGLAQVEARLARQRRRSAAPPSPAQRVHADPAGPRGRRQAGLRPAQRPVRRTRSRCARAAGNDEAVCRPGRADLQGRRRRGHRARARSPWPTPPGTAAAAPAAPTSTRNCRTRRSAPARPSRTGPTAYG